MSTIPHTTFHVANISLPFSFTLDPATATLALYLDTTSEITNKGEAKIVPGKIATAYTSNNPIRKANMANASTLSRTSLPALATWRSCSE